MGDRQAASTQQRIFSVSCLYRIWCSQAWPTCESQLDCHSTCSPCPKYQCPHVMLSHPAHFADVDSRLPQRLHRCGCHPLPQGLTPPPLPLHTPLFPGPRQLSHPLLLSAAVRILQLELLTSLPRLRWLPRKLRRSRLDMERPPQHQVSFLLILPTCMQAPRS